MGGGAAHTGKKGRDGRRARLVRALSSDWCGLVPATSSRVRIGQEAKVTRMTASKKCCSHFLRSCAKVHSGHVYGPLRPSRTCFPSGQTRRAHLPAQSRTKSSNWNCQISALWSCHQRPQARIIGMTFLKTMPTRNLTHRTRRLNAVHERLRHTPSATASTYLTPQSRAPILRP